jgi:uncharacterized membrane protein
VKTIAKISAFIPLAVTLVWLQFLPDQVPLHYDAAGNIDRWGSKWEYLLLPCVALALAAVIAGIGRLLRRKAGTDEKEIAHAAANGKVLRLVLIGLCLFFTGLQAAMLLGAGREAASGAETASVPMMKVTAIGMGILLVFLGNLMPKARRNSALGLRCAWTQYNDVTWQKGNRFGGWALMAAGLATISAVLPAPEGWAMPILLAGILIATVASLIYAKKVYDAESKL